MNPLAHESSNPLTAGIDAGLPCPRRPRSSLGLCALAALGLALGNATAALATTYVVNTTEDPGPAGTTSLREAVAGANLTAGNIVEFDADLVGSTITLATGEISFEQPMSIVGPGPGLLTISGYNASRIFYINALRSSIIHIEGLTLTQGNASPGNGGAIYSYGAYLELSNVAISGNTANTGGGVGATRGYVHIDHSLVSGNFAAGSGGGIASVQAYSLLVDSSTVSGNTANGYGGGILAEAIANVVVEKSLISGNSVLAPGGPNVNQGGGGLALLGVTAVASIFNSTVTGNSAYAPGGGIGIFDAATGSLASCYFSTITGNYAGGQGSNGIFALGTPVIDSCIVANNFSRQDDTDLVGTLAAMDSLIKNPGTATVSGTGDILGLDPLLGALADNGGPTLSMLPAVDSPAIDAGDNNTGGVVADQRGLPRPAGSGKDIGSVERQYPEDLVFRNGFDPR